MQHGLDLTLSSSWVSTPGSSLCIEIAHLGREHHGTILLASLLQLNQRKEDNLWASRRTLKPPGVGDAAPLYLSPGPVFLQTTGVLPGSGLPVTP